MDVPMELRVDVLLPVPDGGKVPDSPAVFARAPAGCAPAAAASGLAPPAVVVLAEASAAAPAIAAPANTAAIASAPLDPPLFDATRRVIGVGVGAVWRFRTRGSGEKASPWRVVTPKVTPAEVCPSSNSSCPRSRR